MLRDVWWADVLRAADILGARTPEEFYAIANILGFAVGSDAAGSPPSGSEPAPFPVAPERSGEVAHPDEQEEDELGEASIPDSGVGRVLEPIGSEPVGTSVAEGPVLAGPSNITELFMPRHWSLLTPGTAHGILQHLLSRMPADGPLDLPAVVETIARGQPPVDLPRRRQRTLRFGTQILVDVGENMQPFRYDQVQAIGVVREVVGRDLTTVLYFADAPVRGVGPGPRWTWQPYEPPPRSTTVLLMTDFGIGGDWLSPGRSTMGEWVSLFDLLSHHGCLPVALVPYPSSRWPRQLRLRCPMVMWDRATTVGRVGAALR